MKQLHKHKLAFGVAFDYIEDDLNGTNALSSHLLKLLNFSEGHFFTLLPVDANLNNLYDFKGGGILPQYPEVEYVLDGIRSTYNLIPTVRKELAQQIFVELQKHQNSLLIFDDVTVGLESVNGYKFFDNFGYHYNDEIYYLIETQNISSKIIKQGLDDSNSFWHSLCLFTTSTLVLSKKELSNEKIASICSGTEMFMIGAYDGEGYVIWEKNNPSSGRTFFPDSF